MADTVIILNDKAVIDALNKAPEQLIAALQPAIERWQYKRVAELARYPSQNPATRYRRTGTLGRTWRAAKPTWQASKSGFESKIGNLTPYAPFVQGTPQARGMGAWKQAEAVAQAARNELEADVRQAAEAAAAQINGVTA